jgi:hypothetical protein
MARVLKVMCLTAALLVCSGRPAEARLIDWLEELSGPGPFTGNGGLVGTICFGSAVKSEGRAARIVGAAPEDKRKPCAYFDFRHFETENDDNFHQFGKTVGATAYDFGATWLLYRPIELGAGIGFVRFAANDVSTTKMTLTGPRVVIKPLLMLTPVSKWRDSNGAPTTWAKVASVVKLHARQTVILGNLQATDFGVAPGLSTFNVDNDQVTSFGLLIDVTEYWRPWR